MENQSFIAGRSLIQASQLFKDSKLGNFNSVHRAQSENPDDYVYIDKHTWGEIEAKIKLMIDDLDHLSQTNKKLEEALDSSRSERNRLIFNHDVQIKALKSAHENKVDAVAKESTDARSMKGLKDQVSRLARELEELKLQNDDMSRLNNMLEENSEKDRKAWSEYQRLSESKYREALGSLVKERDHLRNKVQSERQVITENVQSAYKAEKKISCSKMLVLEKQSEFLGAELSYHKKKVTDLENDKRFLESKIDSYQKQLQVVMDCVSGLEQRFALKESKLITDSQFETLKHSINFNL